MSMQETQISSLFGKIPHVVEQLGLWTHLFSLCSRAQELQLLSLRAATVSVRPRACAP